ncbi:hypothetical protein LINPERHAP1_LOCUS16173 [Linum perenne]
MQLRAFRKPGSWVTGGLKFRQILVRNSYPWGS